MTKTLVIILNHNVPNIADNLYNMIKPYEKTYMMLRY